MRHCILCWRWRERVLLRRRSARRCPDRRGACSGRPARARRGSTPWTQGIGTASATVRSAEGGSSNAVTIAMRETEQPRSAATGSGHRPRPRRRAMATRARARHSGARKSPRGTMQRGSFRSGDLARVRRSQPNWNRGRRPGSSRRPRPPGRHLAVAGRSGGIASSCGRWRDPSTLRRGGCQPRR